MFQNAVSGMEKRLFPRMSPGTYQAVKEATKLGAVAGSIYGITNLASKFLGKLAAYADFDYKTGQYFCNPDRLDLGKLEFSTYVHDINAALVSFASRHPEASMSRLNEYVIGDGKDLSLTGKMAECLAEVHHTDPDTVAQFSQKTQEVFSYDLPKLAEIAPGLVQYATVPEIPIPILARLSVLGGAVGLYLLVSKLPYVKENVRKTVSYFGHGIRKFYKKNK